jgi:hypothetical protein
VPELSRHICKVAESQGVTVRFRLKDEQAQPVPKADLTSATLSLYLADGTILNTRDAQDILNGSGFDVDINATTGRVTWTVQDEDVEIQNDALDVEVHYALFTFVFRGLTFRHIVELRVRNTPNLP